MRPYNADSSSSLSTSGLSELSEVIVFEFGVIVSTTEQLFGCQSYCSGISVYCYCFRVGLIVLMVGLIVLFVNSLVSDKMGYCLKPIMTTNDLLFWAKGYCCAGGQAESCSLTS